MANMLQQVILNASNNILYETNNNVILKGYTKREIKPADKAELVSVAKAMNEDFEPRVRKLFNPEVIAAEEALQTGLYIGYRCPEFNWDCIRVCSEHKCFCGHLLNEHEKFDGNK